MRLSALAESLPHRRTGAASDPEITLVTHDSRRVVPGALFAAFPGARADGRAFLPEAVTRGARAALGLAPAPSPLSIPYLEVEGPRRAAGLLAARLAGEPSSKLLLIGVTGTSGKTTTTLLLDALLASRHPKRGLFGTIAYRGASGEPIPAARTTPEATDLQPMLQSLVAEGGTAAVMECSSHALALDRLSGCAFDVAVFLNLSRDHLDFHRDLDDYFEAKARLFGMLKPGGTAVVNADDAYGLRLFAGLPQGRAITFALGANARADVKATVRLEPARTVLSVTDFVREHTLEIVSPLLGRPNAENLLAAAAIGGVLGIPPEEIERSLASVARIPGRFEPVPNGLGFTVLVDYAHKPGALEGALQTARSLASSSGGRVVVLFGCGGDRDRGKRPEMGRIAASLADETIVTSDNPRSEDPGAILDEIRAGVEAAGGRAAYIVDRREAIAEALRRSRPNDIVLIAGKGHETTQVIGGRILPFDDRLVALQLLKELEGARA